jgi:hypothetical protein
MPSGTSKNDDKASAAKSAKALQAAKSRSGGPRKGSQASVVAQRTIPWVTIAAAFVVVLLVAGIAIALVPKFQSKAAADRFVPSAANPDPSTSIDGVVSKTYTAGVHVTAAQRVNYDQSPPFGGPHDQIWATCNGVVYPNALRSENAVHSLEHGAVWITYNPDDLSTDQVTALAAKVENKPFLFMSPYPGLDQPVSLQGWGRQLKLTDPTDKRIGEFISAVRGNQSIYPEPGATCDTTSPALFDPTNPPPADSGPAPAGAVQMDGTGAAAVGGAGMAEPAPVNPSAGGAVPTAPVPTAAVPTAAVPTAAVPTAAVPTS